jgi:anti-anti-sigma regulatory factor
MAKKAPIHPSSLALEGDLDVFSIHLQWERLQPLLANQNGALEVDLKAVSDLDLSGVQLLATLARDLRAKGTVLKLSGCKDEWAERFRPLGLASLFQGENP